MTESDESLSSEKKLTASTSQRLKPIDGLRTLSVGMVVFSHLLYRSDFSATLPRYKIIFFPHGGLGVLIFFFISGFVITLGLQAEEKHHPVSLLSFYVRRVLRIMPPLILYLLAISTLIYFRYIPNIGSDILLPLLFACNIVYCAPVVAHSWSLAYEEQFYLIMPWIFIFAAGRRSILCAPAVFITFLLFIGMGDPRTAFLINLDCLAFGVAAASFWPILQRYIATLPSCIAPLSLLSLLLYVVIEQKILQWIGPQATLLLRIFIVQGLIALAVLSSIESTGLYRQVLESRPMQQLGVASYGIYLWQQLTTGPLGGQVSVGGYVLLNIAMLGWCILLYRYFDLPFIAFGRRISRMIAAKETSHPPRTANTSGNQT